MNLYIMRHGETEWNKKRLFQGAADIPLTGYGKELAALTRDGFDRDGICFQRIYTSPLIRARQTAGIINETRHVPIVIDDRIREINFGKYEGTDYRGIDQNIKYCLTIPSLYEPDPSAESFTDFFDRIRNFMEEELLPLESNPSFENVLVVCHGAVIRAFLMIIRHMDLDEFWSIRQQNCSVNLILIKNGVFRIIRENILYYENKSGSRI